MAPGKLGEYFYFESVLGMASVFATLGVAGATEKFISEGTEENSWFTTGFILIFSFSIVSSILLTIINTFKIEVIIPDLIPLLFIALTSKQLLTFLRHSFRAEFRAAMGGALDFIRIVLFIVVSISFLRLEFGYIGIISAAILARVTVLPIGISQSKYSFVRPSFTKASKLLDFGKYYFITSFGSKVFHFSDVILIGILLTKSGVGKYEVTWRLILAGIMLNGTIAGTAFSYISQSSSEMDLNLVRKNIEQSLRYALIIPFGVLGGAIVIGTDMIELVFSTEYTSDNLLIIILAFGFVFQAFYFLFSRSLVAVNKTRQSFYATNLGVISNISLNLFLIPKFGILGAAAATSLSFMIAAFIFGYYLMRYVEFKLPYQTILIQVVGSTVMTASLILARGTLKPLSSLNIIFLFLLGSMIYFSVLFTPQRTRSDIKNIVSEFK
ncbi:lipid II flippase MurJ [Halorubrum ezzemoulense]|nr:polysaccharide biosynthesis C-terminal domain-containing protein [Halorubrum ezzemoulense]